MDNDKYNSQDIKKVCENKLGLEFRSGKEFNAWLHRLSHQTGRYTRHVECYEQIPQAKHLKRSKIL